MSLVGPRLDISDNIRHYLPQHMKKLSKNSADRVVIICGEVASTGARAAGLMKKAGIEKVVNLKGGITGWQRDNLPLKKGK